MFKEDPSAETTFGSPPKLSFRVQLAFASFRPWPPGALLLRHLFAPWLTSSDSRRAAGLERTARWGGYASGDQVPLYIILRRLADGSPTGSGTLGLALFAIMFRRGLGAGSARKLPHKPQKVARYPLVLQHSRQVNDSIAGSLQVRYQNRGREEKRGKAKEGREREVREK